MTRTQRKFAHLALDPTRIATTTTGDHAFLQNLVEYTLMKRRPLHRGE